MVAAQTSPPSGEPGTVSGILKENSYSTTGLAPRRSGQRLACGTIMVSRRPPTNRIVLANRGNDPDQVMQLAEERAPGGFDDLDAVIHPDEFREIAQQYKMVAGFDKDELSQRPSFDPPV